jgi:hypothetical protein
MINIVLVGGVLLQAAIIAALIVLGIHQHFLARTLTTTRREQERWEGEQKSHAGELESRLTAQIEQLQQAYQTWQASQTQRIEDLAQQYEGIVTQLQVEHEVGRLRRVEDLPVSSSRNGQGPPPFADWRPARLGRANLSQRDLSHRYLADADLHEANLTGANFGLSDLSGADLADANLSEVNLTGAKLVGANLRNAILTEANLLVADLEGAVLIGANLLGVRNLTPQQLASAIYDQTTQLDAALDLHLSAKPGDK